MKKSSPRSPRARAHPLKVSEKNGRGGKNNHTTPGSKKKKKKNNKHGIFSNTDEVDEDRLLNHFSDDPDEISTYRSLDTGSIHSAYSAGNKSIGQFMKVH